MHLSLNENTLTFPTLTWMMTGPQDMKLLPAYSIRKHHLLLSGSLHGMVTEIILLVPEMGPTFLTQYSKTAPC